MKSLECFSEKNTDVPKLLRPTAETPGIINI